MYLCIGEMAERSIAAVLKTVEGNTSGGSNPSLSAKYQSKCLDESRGIFHLQLSQACLSEIKQMKNEGGEATEAFTRYFAGLP